MKTNKQVLIKHKDDNSINISVFNNKILMEIAGSLDSNLKELEKISGSTIYFRGNSITIRGKKNANEKVRDAIEYLIERFNIANKIDRNDILSSFNKDIIKDMKNESHIQPLEEVIKTPKRSVIPRSKKQKEYVRALKTNQIIMSFLLTRTTLWFLTIVFLALSVILA